MDFSSKINNRILIIAVLILVVLTFATCYYGSTDIGDYADTAKYFTGSYKADIRNSHSYLFGFIHAPLLALFGSFIVFKVTSLIFLSLIIYSTYIMSGKDPKALYLALLSPVVWYLAPWINPVQLASLCLLWSVYFISRYEIDHKTSHLVYSGILIGLGWAFWNTLAFFAFFLMVCFLYDKKSTSVLAYLIAIGIGLLPLMLFDQFYFGFPFYTLLKTTASNLVATLLGGIDPITGTTSRLLRTLLIAITIPFSFWRFYSKEKFKENARIMIFITLSLLLILSNPQVRYLIALTPLMIIIIVKEMTKREFKRNLLISIVVVAFFMAPYLIQITSGFDSDVYGRDITRVIEQNPHLALTSFTAEEKIKQDLVQISQEYPDKSFIVGNAPDDYQTLAHFYWGDKVNEFVSIQDYQLFLENKSVIFEKRLQPKPRLQERREIWIGGGMIKNTLDTTNYSSIDFAIGLGEPVKLEGFVSVKNYTYLYLSKRVNRQ